jgi:hypothetical protein
MIGHGYVAKKSLQLKKRIIGLLERAGEERWCRTSRKGELFYIKTRWSDLERSDGAENRS